MSRDARRLRRPAALGRQGRQEVMLRPDPAARDEAGDQPLALRLPERTRVRLHRTSIVIEPSPEVSCSPGAVSFPDDAPQADLDLIYGLFGALAAIAARFAASRVYRVVTEEEPPLKK